MASYKLQYKSSHKNLDAISNLVSERLRNITVEIARVYVRAVILHLRTPQYVITDV